MFDNIQCSIILNIQYQVVDKEGVQIQNPPGKLQNGLSTSKSAPKNSNVDFDCNSIFQFQCWFQVGSISISISSCSQRGGPISKSTWKASKLPQYVLIHPKEPKWGFRLQSHIQISMLIKSWLDFNFNVKL